MPFPVMAQRFKVQRFKVYKTDLTNKTAVPHSFKYLIISSTCFVYAKLRDFCVFLYMY